MPRLLDLVAFPLCLTLVAAGPSLAAAEPVGAVLTEDTPRSAKPIFVNYNVSSKTIALNQPLRLEFTTVPRQIEGVDIASVVANGIELVPGAAWKLLARPLVTEHAKLKTVTVVVTLLPRTTGSLRLPQFPLSWLIGEPLPEFGPVAVGSSIVVAGDNRKLPAEFDGLAGVPWGSTVDEARDRLPAATWATTGTGTTAVATATTGDGLTLLFNGGMLAEGTLTTEGTTLAEARLQFVNRWGMPLSEEPTKLIWSLGWTRITAEGRTSAPAAGASTASATAAGTDTAAAATAAPAQVPGITLRFLREDQRLRQNAARVQDDIFRRLEGGSDAPVAPVMPAGKSR